LGESRRRHRRLVRRARGTAQGRRKIGHPLGQDHGVEGNDLILPQGTVQGGPGIPAFDLAQGRLRKTEVILLVLADGHSLHRAGESAIFVHRRGDDVVGAALPREDVSHAVGDLGEQGKLGRKPAASSEPKRQ